MKALLVWLVLGVPILSGQVAPNPTAAKPAAATATAPAPAAGTQGSAATKSDSSADVKQEAPKRSAPKVLTAPIDAEWQTKVFDVQFADPERLRAVFSGRSFVMEANRDLKVLTAHGTPAFLKEVEEAVKRFDVPPPPPANVQLTVYLLTSAAQAPAGVAVPAELAAISKEFGSPTSKLADSQVLRVREGQSGQLTGLESKPDASTLSRVWLQSASVGVGRNGEMVSLYGLRVWLNVPSTSPAGAGTGTSMLRADPDVSADVDVDSNQPVMVSKVGVADPVIVVVRATVVR
jgi:hypothetical protein